MLETFLITSRETLEIGLIVGIVLSYLSKTNQQKYNKIVFYSIAAGIILSIIFAFLFSAIAGNFEGTAEALFEGTIMLLAAFLVTTMILFMLKHNKMAHKIEKKVSGYIEDAQLSKTGLVGLFVFITISILKEGVEIVLFLNAISYTTGLNLLSALLGVILSIVISFALFFSAKKMNVKKFFTITGILLIFFSAGLVAHGVYEFEEAGVISGIISPIWDVNHILDEKSVFGEIMKGLFGYNGNPSLLEVLVYISYLSIIFFIYKKMYSVETA